MIDTLKIAEILEEGADGFSASQARKLAAAIAQGSDDRRLRDLEIKVGVQAVLTTIVLAATLAIFWQLYTLRGELSGFAAETRTRLQVIEQRVDVWRPR